MGAEIRRFAAAWAREGYWDTLLGRQSPTITHGAPFFACAAAACAAGSLAFAYAPAQARPATGNAAATLGSNAEDSNVSADVTIWNYSPDNLYPSYFRSLEGQSFTPAEVISMGARSFSQYGNPGTPGGAAGLVVYDVRPPNRQTRVGELDVQWMVSATSRTGVSCQVWTFGQAQPPFRAAMTTRGSQIGALDLNLSLDSPTNPNGGTMCTVM